MTDLDVFQPGTQVVIELGDPNKLGKATSVLRGLKRDQFLLLDLPQQGQTSTLLQAGAQCIVRFIHEGRIIGFRSRVIGMLNEPEGLLFLQFPNHVESSKLRKHDRFPVEIDAVCATERLDGLVDAYPRDIVLNLSEGGCMVSAFESFAKNAIVHITFFLPRQGQVNDVEAEVKRLAPKGEKYLLGLEFTDYLDPGYSVVRDYVKLLQSYRVRA